MKRTVTLEIAGQRYRMSSDADEAHLAKLADLVNDRIAALGPRVARTTTPQQLLAVVALGLADELVQSEQRRKDVERATVDTVGRAIALIDEELVRLRPEDGEPPA